MRLCRLHATLADGGRDTQARLTRIFVLPHRYKQPPRIPQSLLVLDVATLVPLDFLRPVRRVGGGGSVVLWASVPEATADFHGNMGWPENDVGCPPYLWYRAGAHTVPQSEGVQFLPQGQLRLGVPAPVRLHGLARRGA